MQKKQNINYNRSWNLAENKKQKIGKNFRDNFLGQRDDIIAKEILKHSKKLLIVDVDSIFKNDFDWPKTNYGYFPREHKYRELQVAAGCVYFQEAAIETLPQLENKIASLPLEWYVDQKALEWYFRNVIKDSITYFDDKFMDWEFKDNTVLWTGKGKRKTRNVPYLNAKKECEKINISS